MDTQGKDNITAGHQAPEEKGAETCKCIRCGKTAAYKFPALEVRTLHIRDMDKEKRVQALGDFKNFAVCKDCAEQKLADLLAWQKAVMNKCIPFGLVFVVGAILTAVFFSKDRVLMMLGIIAMICGVLGIWSSVTEGRKKIREYEAKTKERALYDAAWETVVDCAPKKEGDNDLTYILIDQETLERKNGDLMILYDLLPEIAVQAHKRIHKKYDSASVNVE